MKRNSTNSGYDEFLDGVEAGSATYLRCDCGRGALPPRDVCPDCGSGELAEESLPQTGTVETHTTTHVSSPSFQRDTPYTVLIVDLGPLRLSGQLQDAENISIGDEVSVDVVSRGDDEDRILVFRPAD